MGVTTKGVMKMNGQILKKAAALSLGVSCVLSMQAPNSFAVDRAATDRPNIIYINTDDLGYGDVGCYGSTLNKTPNIDRMAEEGVRFTDFYACPLCTPSRASLMTGCYPLRVGLPSVIGARASIGLNPDEITIAENLKTAGYATALVGKWHLGHHEEFLPTNHGFDSYFGIPYSNDFLDPSLPLMRDTEVVEWDPDQSTLTQRYTEECINFMKRNRNNPFFLYFAHMYVHKPLRVTDEALAASDNGAYGATVEQVDWSVGQILQAVEDLGLERNTLIIFTSDNGGFLQLSPSEGDTGQVSNAPLRGGKGQANEGGVRVPFIVRWPGQIPKGQETSEVASVMDMFPTFSHLAGVEMPDDRVIDGEDIFSLMQCQRGAVSPHENIFIYVDKDLRAVRHGKWKLNVHNRALYNLEADIGEQNNLYSQYPDIVAELTDYINEAIQDIGDNNTVGQNARPAGDAGSSNSVYDNVNGETVEESVYRDVAVMDMLDALPPLEELDKNNPDHRAAVEAAREAFNGLTEYEQEMVMAANYEILLAAEAAMQLDTTALQAQVRRAQTAVEEQEGTPGGKFLAEAYEAFYPVYEAAAALLADPAGQDGIDRMAEELAAAIDRLYTMVIPAGDLNGDGRVTIEDVMAACKIIARQQSGGAPDAAEIQRGDLNGDGRVTIEDVMAICKIIARGE